MMKIPAKMKKPLLVIFALVSIGLVLRSLPHASNGESQISTPVATGQTETENEDKTSGSTEMTEISQAVRTAGKKAAATGCDEKLWEHVYNPSRLTVINKCVAVTGVIEKIKYNEDGDAHIDVRLDTAYSGMVNSYNESEQDGDLVVESVCDHKPTAEKANDICDNFSSNVSVPPIGSHVSIKGAFVLDTHNGWTEIHPVSTISVK